MSTYYYLVCDGHKIVSDVIGGRSFPDRWWQNDGGELPIFLREHGNCEPPPRLVSEHEDVVYEYTELRADGTLVAPGTDEPDRD